MTGLGFSAAVWAESGDLRRGIDGHPFVAGLLHGTLPRAAFDHYVEQDAHYLTGYAAALQACAAQADSAASAAFWATAARDTVEIEKSLHEQYLHGRPLPSRSASCSAYVSLLLDAAVGASPAVLVAAVLPCFWIFSDLGRRWAGVDLAGHPYADWVETYRDARFAAATDQARAIVDELASGSPPVVQARMREAFRSACRYERLLFDDAWSGAAERLNGSASTSAMTNEANEADSHG